MKRLPLVFIGIIAVAGLVYFVLPFSLNVSGSLLAGNFLPGNQTVKEVVLDDFFFYNCEEGILHFDTLTYGGNQSDLYLVNITTGTGTLKQSHVGNWKDTLAVDRNRRLFTIGKDSLGNEHLVQLNPDGSNRFVGPTNTSDKISQLAFGPDRKLYAMGNQANGLYRINVNRGKATLLHSFTLIPASSGDIAIDGNNLMLFLRNNGEIYTMDLNNFSTEALAGTLPQGGRVYTGVVFKNGTYYGNTQNGVIHEFTLGPLRSAVVTGSGGQFMVGDAGNCPG